MTRTSAIRPRDAGLSDAALANLAALYEHPVVRTVARAFAPTGAQLFLVGGPVRDALRGHADFSDLDFTTSLRPPDTRRVLDPLGALWNGGAALGTIGVHVSAGGTRQQVEVTTFRTEAYDPDSRNPLVAFGDDIVADLERRDLTINAVAMNVVDGTLVDPFGGIEAIRSGKLTLDSPRDPVETLSDDPLRILRAIRFAGRFQAPLSDRLAAAAAVTGPRLAIVHAERRLKELDRLAELGAAALAGGLTLAGNLGVLPYWVLGARPPRPGEGLAHCETLEEMLTVLWDGLGDDEVGVHMRSMRLPVVVMRRVRDLRVAVAASRRRPVAAADVRRMLRAADDATLAGALRVLDAVGEPTEIVRDALRTVLATEPGVRDPLPVTGNDLRQHGLTGPAVGAALRELHQLVCEHGHVSRDKALAHVIAAPAL